MSNTKTHQVAESVPFDNSTNGFTATDVQVAIEEVNFRVLKMKVGTLTPADFSGSPLTATIVFVTPYVDSNYSVTINGQDKRSWSYESKYATGFVINANANQPLTGNVSWETIYKGEN